MSLLSSLEYYDTILRGLEHNNSEASASSWVNRTRKGNLAVIPMEEGLHKEIAICNLAALIPASINKGFYLQDMFGLATLQIALAVQHLNEGNGSIIPDVQSLNQRCNIRFTLELIDTGLVENIAVDEVIRVTDRQWPPVCAFQGASRSAVSMATATITGLRGYPQISAASTSPVLSNEDHAQQLYPLFGRTIPADDGIARPIIQHFHKILGINHVGVLYVNDPYGTAFARGLHEAAAIDAPTMSIKSVEIAPIESSDESVKRAVQELKATGFRYIFAILNNDILFEKVMLEAYDQEIAGTGRHTWMFSDSSMGAIIQRTTETNSPIHKALQGTGIIMASGGQAEYNPILDQYRNNLNELLNPTELEYIISQSPNPNAFDIDAMMNSIRFDENDAYGPFIYDSIIALGLGACDAADAAEVPTEYFNGQDHFDAIARSTFVGTSGPVQLNPETGSREPSSTYYGLNRVVFREDSRNATNQLAHTTLTSLFDHGTWRELEPFVYADGSATPLDDLPDVGLDPNYLGSGWRVSGWAMCGLTIILALTFASWTRTKSDNHIVTASQPFFLYLICFGIVIFASSIIPLGFDEEIATADGCTIACNGFIWLISIGFCVTFSALFTKTQRVNMIFKNPGFKRIKVTPLDVAKPMAVCLSANFLVLVLMAVIAPLEWTVETLDEDDYGRPTETQGFCNWSNSIPFLIPLAFINLCCLLYSLVQAYEARGISIEFAESEYIFRCTLVIALACFLSFPVLVLIHDNNNAFYFFLSATIFITGSLVLLLIFVPKIRHIRHKNMYPKKRVRVSISVPNGFQGNSRPMQSSMDLDSSSDESSGLLVLSHPRIEAKLKERVAVLERRLQDCKCSSPTWEFQNVELQPLSGQNQSVEQPLTNDDDVVTDIVHALNTPDQPASIENKISTLTPEDKPKESSTGDEVLTEFIGS